MSTENKKYRSMLLYVLIIIFAAIDTSCKKFVEIDPPINRLVTETVFENSVTANAAVTNIYIQMLNSSHSMAKFTGYYGDELTSYSTTETNVRYYTNSLNAQNLPPTLWTEAYGYIYRANLVIQGLEASTSLDQTLKNQLKGEALFVRAFWHFYLTNLYGDVPIILTTDHKVNAVVKRVSQDVVYDQIKEDLKEAKTLLSSDFVNATGLVSTTERTRPNQWAASALLARVYLYTGDNQGAVRESSIVIGNTSLFSLKSNLSTVFLANSTEAIWQLQIPLPTTFNTPDGRYFVLTTTPGTSADNSATLSPQLQNSFESSDQRKTNWTKAITVGIQSYTFPFKYRVNSGGTVSEYIMVLRLAELYLIRAEARAKSGDISGAQADVNVIRNRAGLVNTTANDQSSVIAAIQKERRIELFVEWGHRWLDLKRMNSVDAQMNSIASNKGATWESFKKLYPIAQSELNANINLMQNPGY